MNKKDTDLQDIYRAEKSGQEQTSASASYTAEMIEQEMRRRLVFNISAGLLAVGLAIFITISVVKDFLPPPRPVEGATKSTAFYTAFAPSEGEQWALEYRQVAYQADNSEPAGPKALSSKWVKNVAYHIIMGDQALQISSLTLAQSHLELAVATFPAITGVRGKLGMIYLKQHLFEKAVEQLQKALGENPSAVDVLNNLGVAYIGVQEYGRAEKFLRLASEQQPDLAGCYKNLALVYQKTGRTNEAVAAFEKYFSLQPEDSQLLGPYVDFLVAAGRTRDAIGFLDRFEGGDTLSVRLLQARTAAQNNDTESAVRALRDAARFLSPRQMIIKMHDPSFAKIAKAEPFEKLVYQLELATVSHLTNLTAKGDTP